MTVETVRLEKLHLTASTPEERASWLTARVTEEGACLTVRVTTDGANRIAADIRLATSAQVAALEDALRVMRMRMAEAEQAALTK